MVKKLFDYKNRKWYVHTAWWGSSGPYQFSVACIAANNVLLNTGTKPHISLSPVNSRWQRQSLDTAHG